MKTATNIIHAMTMVTAITLVVKGPGFVEKILLAYFSALASKWRWPR